MDTYFPYNRKPFYYETDKMGIVHHSNYVRWFEEARLDLLEQAGFSYKDMEDLGVLIPVLEVNVEYLNFIKYDEEVSIFVKVTNFTGVRLEMAYEVYRNSDNTLCAKGTSQHTFVDVNMKVLRLKRDFQQIYDFFKKIDI